MTMLIKCMLVLALILSIPHPPAAQSTNTRVLPDTLAGREVREFLRKFNAQEYKEIRWQRWFSIYGPLEFQFVSASSDHAITAWTKGKLSKGWFGVRLTLKPQPPHTLEQIIALTGIRPEGSKLNREELASAQIVDRVKDYLNQLSSSGRFSGSVLVAKDGAVIFKQAYGMASRRYQVPNSVDTKFNLASTTKMFTAVAIAQLAQQGKLGFDDPISKYLPNYPGETAKKITIHQLLTHTSGLGQSRFNEASVTDRFIRTIDEQLAMTVAPPQFEPGTNVNYNNEAWILLGAIIEKVSGQKYYDYVQKYIYDLAGMVNSGAFEEDQEIPNLASRYSNLRLSPDGSMAFEPGPRRNTFYMANIKGSPAGGTYSTIEDLYRFSTALLGNKLLDPQFTKLVMTRHIEVPTLPGEGAKRGFGYGFEIEGMGPTQIVSKRGGSAGVSTEIDIYPERGYTVIVLSNYDSIGNIVAGHIKELIGP